MTGNAKTEHWGVLGEWANLTCVVKAEPPARFEWLHRGRKLSASDEVFIVSEENKSTLQVRFYQGLARVVVKVSFVVFTNLCYLLSPGSGATREQIW